MFGFLEHLHANLNSKTVTYSEAYRTEQDIKPILLLTKYTLGT